MSSSSEAKDLDGKIIKISGRLAAPAKQPPTEEKGYAETNALTPPRKVKKGKEKIQKILPSVTLPPLLGNPDEAFGDLYGKGTVFF